LKRWPKYVKPYKLYFILGPVFIVSEVVGEVLVPRLFAEIMNNIDGKNPSASYVLLLAGGMVLNAILMMIFGVVGSYFVAKAAVYFASDLRADAFEKLQRFSFKNIDRFSAGSLITRLTNDITQIQNFVNMLLRMCLRSPSLLILAFIMAVSLNAKVALVIAAVIPLLLLSQGLIIKKGFARFGKMQEKIDSLNTNVRENLTNVRVVKSFVREDFENQKFSVANTELKDATFSALMIMIIMQPMMTLCINLATLGLIWFGGREVIIGGMEIGYFSAMLTYIMQILMSLVMLTFVFIMSSRAIASAKRVAKVLDEKIDINDVHVLYPDKKVERGSVEFKDVSFRYYENSEEKVLKNISLKIEGGKTVGIIGSTGCGKTTLVSLIPRLYDASEGEVLVDGVNVREYNLKNLRDGIGMVLQNNFLFSGTIKDNILWGDENADESEVETFAKMAQAHGFISSFTDGYYTELGQGGVNVSGGQKQRLCIARALIKKPKILILDDRTSAVDTATEKRIREALKNELRDSTKIIIAQRISSVIDADEIVVMNEGKITGIGTHEELLKTNSEYQEIYYTQTDKKGGV